MYCDFDKNLTRVTPTSVKLNPENSRLTLEYEDQISSLIAHSGMCVQYAFASEKCLNIFWWEDNQRVVHWFRDNYWKPDPAKSDPVIDEFNVPKSLYVKSDFLPIRAIGHSDSNSHPDCNADKVIVEDLVCSGKSYRISEKS